METEGVAISNNQITMFQAVNSHSIGHPGNRSDVERTGLVGADRDATAEDSMKLTGEVGHPYVADDPVVIPRCRGRRAGKSWRMRNGVERWGRRIGTDAAAPNGVIRSPALVSCGKSLIDVNHVVHG